MLTQEEKEQRYISRRMATQDRNLRKQYGISLEEYEIMVKENAGKCTICGSRPTKKRLHIDHCHYTKIVRGLICQSCNLGLGSFKDNQQSLINAAAYLKRFEDSIAGKRIII